MSYYHFPIIIGEHESERVVMIHLTDGDDVENRVIITSGNSQKPIFKIPRRVRLIDHDGQLLEGVNYLEFQKIEEKKVKIKSDINQIIEELFKNGINNPDENEDDLKENLKTLCENESETQEESDVLEKVLSIIELEKTRLDKLKKELKGKRSDFLDFIKSSNQRLKRLKGGNLFVVRTGENIVTLKESEDYYKYYVRNDRNGRFDSDIDFTLMTNYGNDDDTIFFCGKVHISRPSGSDEIMKINVDLGSDATQVNFFSDELGVPIQPVYLIEAMRDLYKPSRDYASLKPPYSQEPLFTQEEKNREFYKTGNITFHKYEDFSKGNIDLDLNDPNTFINYLNVSSAGKNEKSNDKKGGNTWEKEIEFGKKLINIKMLYAHMGITGGYVRDIQYTDSDGGQYSIANYDHLLRVLRSIYHQIISASIKKIGKIRCKYYSVLLLVPNIYAQQNIDYLLSELNKELNDPNNPDSVKYDFRVLSESDAAFVGIKKTSTAGKHGSVLGQIVNGETDPKQKDMFLIIDAGKGTTDYSIIYHDTSNEANNSMSSIKRGGIVGAGGAIDYVFARIFARQVYNNIGKIGFSNTDVKVDENQFVNHFMTLIQMLPPVDQDRIMLVVEMMKKNYKKGQTVKAFSCFDTEEAKTIISNLIKGNADYTTAIGQTDGWNDVSKWKWDGIAFEKTNDNDEKEIDWVCKAIASAVAYDVFEDTEETVTKKIDYIIFTGRSFHFEPLRKAFEEKVRPYRNVFSDNFENPLFVVKLMNRFAKQKKDLMNLKVADLKGVDMKAISVRFDKHDLGVNCNSDLCCVSLLNVVGDDGLSTVEKNCFWEGFDCTIDDKKRYYIGHPKRAFAPPLPQQERLERTPIEKTYDLVMMTMFPVRYVRVQFYGMDLDGVGRQGNVGNTGAAPQNSQNRPANPEEQTSQVNIPAPGSNSISTDSAIPNQTIVIDNNDRLDSNDL